MASLDRVRADIRELANRPKNVEFDEVQRIVKQLGEFYATSSRSTRHGTLFNVGGRRFFVCSHNPGNAQIKKCYVDDFIDAMTDLGLYEE